MQFKLISLAMVSHLLCVSLFGIMYFFGFALYFPGDYHCSLCLIVVIFCMPLPLIGLVAEQYHTQLRLALLFLVSDVAAARPRPLQSRPMDLHARQRAGASLLVPGHRIPQRHPDLQQCATCQHGSPDRAHAQVLLLGGESACEERHCAQGTGRTAPRPEGYSGDPRLYSAVSEAADYDRQWREGGRVAEHSQLPDDDARGRESARCAADVDLVDVGTSELDGASFRHQAGSSEHFQADGCREPADSYAGPETARFLFVAKHTQVSRTIYESIMDLYHWLVIIFYSLSLSRPIIQRFNDSTTLQLATSCRPQKKVRCHVAT